MLAAGLTPDDAEAFNQRGNANRGAGRLADALADYDRALEAHSSHPAALYNRGCVLLLLQRPADALATFDTLLALAPDDTEAQNERGNALAQLDRAEEAVAAYDRALALQPGYPAALYHRGMALRTLGRTDEALASFDAALDIDPDLLDPLANRAYALQELKRHAEALVCFDRLLERRPEDPDALANRSLVLHELKRPDDALRDAERALDLRPDSTTALVARGIALQDLDRQVDALECYDLALAASPRNPVALNNRANALHELGRPREALAGYDAVLAFEPDHAEVRINRSFCLLQTGDFTQGWREYEWRWKGPAGPQSRNFREPLWLGDEPLAGRTILLHAEQGFGDALQFCRYARLVADTGATVLLQVHDPLVPLLAGLKGVTRILGGSDALPAFDFHCPLLSLPLALRTTLETIPAEVPYVACDAARVAAWRERLGPPSRLRVGLIWSGNPEHKNDRNRSLALAQLADVLQVGAEFFSLQKDLRAADAAVLGSAGVIRQFADDIRDFADTAALISQMDVVVSVDTSVAHLAGALGRETWILLPFNPDFRWLLDREDSPWYPTARLFRQPEPGDWESVVSHVARALRARLQ